MFVISNIYISLTYDLGIGMLRICCMKTALLMEIKTTPEAKPM